jgi:Ca2+-binding EF-hand superfamily protein
MQQQKNYSSTSSYQQSYISTSTAPMTTTVQHSVSSSSAAVLMNTGLTDVDGAKSVARKILDTYDRDRNGNVDSIEVVPMIVDTYKSFNRVFSPSRADIESYLKVLDRNGDGRVTLQDLEDLCARYLVGR